MAERETMTKAATTINQEIIQQLRTLLKVPPVKVGHVPQWFSRGLRKLLKDRGDRPPFGKWEKNSLLQTAFQKHYGLLDHWGSTVLKDKRVAFVLEPYWIEGSALLFCEALREQLGCDFWVSPTSWHFPGATFQLMFVEKRLTGESELPTIGW